METCKSVKCEKAKMVLEKITFVFSVVAAVAILAIAGAMIVRIVMDAVHIFPLVVQNGLVPQVYKLVIGAINVLILLEIMELFLKFETQHRVSIHLIMDTAITFAVREVIIWLYDGKTGGPWFDSPIAIVICLVALRIFLVKEQQGKES